MSQLIPDHVLLGLLAVEATHGYELLSHFREDSQLGRVWNLSTSQLYAVLKRLEQKGWIRGEVVAVPDAPARTQYCLSPEGAAEFETWLNEPNPSASIRRIRVEFLSRLYIMRLLNRPTLPLVMAQRRSCQHQLAHLQDELARAGDGIGLLTLELVIAQLQGVLTWLDRCELRPLEEFET